MKRLFFSVALVVLAFGVASISYADDAEKFNHLGVGRHGSFVKLDDVHYDHDDSVEFSGYSIYYQRNMAKNGALRFSAYFDEYEGSSEVKNNGFEAIVLLGNNFTQPGVSLMVGCGFFSETWENDDVGVEWDFTGPMLSLGLGYNWKYVRLDFLVNIRGTSDYEDELETEHLESASGSLTIGARF